jgi:phospho-N-acetylmuramoyl-pentapeptide-transferase
LVAFSGKYAEVFGWIVYAIAIILIITAVSNAANLTDGIDGLATGTSAISGATFGILAYVSGNVIYADYLNIMYIPNLGELTVFISAFIGQPLVFCGLTLSRPRFSWAIPEALRWVAFWPFLPLLSGKSF